MIVESYEDVVVLSGALRKNFWETIHTAISLTLKRHPTGVVIDCSGITEITPEGAETFHDAIEFVSEYERARIIVAAVPAPVLEVLRSVPEVRSQLAMADSVEDARRSLDLLLEGSESKKTRPYDRQILCVLRGDSSDEYVIKVTSELVSTLPAKVIIMLPIVVPRELPIQSPMLEQEVEAKNSSEAAQRVLGSMAKACEVKLERTRNLSELVAEAAERFDAAHTVLAAPKPRRNAMGSSQDIDDLLSNVKRPILIVRGKVD